MEHYTVPETWREARNRYWYQYGRPIAQAAVDVGGPIVSNYVYNELERALSGLGKRTRSGKLVEPPRYSQLTNSQSSAQATGSSRRAATSMGYFSGKFSKRGRTKSSYYPASLKNEVSAIVTPNNDCVFAGHGAAYVKVLRVVMMALYERLRKKQGGMISTWLDECLLDHRILVDHMDGDSTTGFITAVVATNAATDTNLVIVNRMVDWFANHFADTATNNNRRNLEFKVITLEVRDNDTVDTWNRAATIELSNLMVTISYWSHLNLQNQTVGAGAGDVNADDVTANPLVGRHYTGTGNGWRWKRLEPAGVVNAVCTANRETGIILIDKTGYDVQALNFLARPPDKNMLANVQKVGGARLAPGQIRGDTVKKVVKIGLNNLVFKLANCFRVATAGSTTSNLFWFGQYRMFAFEKQMRTGSQISLAYELDQTYRAKIHEKRGHIPAYLTIV